MRKGRRGMETKECRAARVLQEMGVGAGGKGRLNLTIMQTMVNSTSADNPIYSARQRFGASLGAQFGLLSSSMLFICPCMGVEVGRCVPETWGLRPGLSQVLGLCSMLN